MKTVCITGANRGIGSGLAEHYVKQGWRVLATARNVDILPAQSSNFIPLQLDVTNESSIKKLGETVAQLEFKIDVLINNAGVSEQQNLGAWSLQSFTTHLTVNTTGPALVTQELLPHMATKAKIIHISSGIGSLTNKLNPANGLDAYAASKAALNMITRRLAEKVRPLGITVVALSPGWVKTDMGGSEAPLTVAESVALLTQTIEGLSLVQSGLFFTNAGEPIAW